jgi:hypothetical protein
VKDITEVLDHFRISARAVWNNAFWPDPDCRNWDSADQFREIERILFQQLVLEKFEIDHFHHDVFRVPVPAIQIAPSNETRIMIQKPRPNAATGYWDDPVNTISPGQAELHFIEFFDWNHMDYRDFRYYHAEIAKFNDHPELVGREALLDRQSGRAFLKDKQ